MDDDKLFCDPLRHLDARFEPVDPIFDADEPEFPRFRTEAARLLGESEHPLSEQEMETVTQDQLRRQVNELLREKEK